MPTSILSSDTQDHFLNLLRKRKRGTFKLYIGMCAGVGKTYRMLQDAHVLAGKGVDIWLGVIETHNRAETVRMTQGLPTFKLKTLYYQGKALQEFDLEAVLRHRPEVVIIDELAHSNVPGSIHKKRWQDVETVLAAGISVISALNIQHIESLNATIRYITGVEVQERVCDAFIQQADEVVAIDLPVSDLRQRIIEGKIYPPEKIATSLNHFFQENNLLQLRELTLREVARQVDHKLDRLLEPTNRLPTQTIGLLVSSNPITGRFLIRKTARLAENYGARWYVLYVQTAAENTDRINPATQRKLLEHLKLAAEMGAIVETLTSDSVADAALQFARKNQLTLLVTGKTWRSWWQRLLKGNILTDLMTQSQNEPIDILILSTHEYSS
jgi:two-component system sensor histidine kinase KdpD